MILPSQEGWPSCVKAIVLDDDRIAVWSLPCPHPEHWAEREEYRTRTGRIRNTPQVPHLIRIAETREGTTKWAGLPFPLLVPGTTKILYAGDSSNIAKTAWKRAEYWVRVEE